MSRPVLECVRAILEEDTHDVSRIYRFFKDRELYMPDGPVDPNVRATMRVLYSLIETLDETCGPLEPPANSGRERAKKKVANVLLSSEEVQSDLVLRE